MVTQTSRATRINAGQPRVLSDLHRGARITNPRRIDIKDQSGTYFFLFNADTDGLLRTAVPFSDVKTTVDSIAGKTLFFVDTCHSGNVMGTRRDPTDINGVINELASTENWAVVFSASTRRQFSLEDPAWGNGAFTEALVEGLTGKADLKGTG